MKTGGSRVIWSRDELIVVLDVYFRLPRAKFDAAAQEVMEVARLIDRTPAAVAKRLANYRFFDEGIGLAHGGAHAKKLWEDLGGNPRQVGIEAVEARARLALAQEAKGKAFWRPEESKRQKAEAGG